jgi:hypothetical protein
MTEPGQRSGTSFDGGLHRVGPAPTVRVVRRLPFALAGIVLVVATAGVAASFSTSAGAVSRAGSCPNGKPPSASVTKVQAIQLDLLRRSSFNNLKGARVARDLLKNRKLWCGALIDRLGGDALIKLRDLDENVWNVDTLYVLSSGANDRLLTRLARRWHADAISWVGGAAASRLLGDSRAARVLDVWWD